MSDELLCKPMCSCDSSAEPLDLSKTSKVYPFFHPHTSESEPYRDAMQRSQPMMKWQISTDSICEPPQIRTQPKEIWHYRNVKELGKKHHPLLAGEGPQRTPIRVTVSTSRHCHALSIYLVTRYQHSALERCTLA